MPEATPQISTQWAIAQTMFEWFNRRLTPNHEGSNAGSTEARYQHLVPVNAVQDSSGLRVRLRRKLLTPPVELRPSLRHV